MSDRKQQIHNQKSPNLPIIYMVTMLAVMGVASITPAFPAIMRYYGITGRQVGLLIVYFTLPGVVLAPFMGVLADRLGRKPVLVPSLFLFAIAGVACMFTRNWHFLLILRFVQGMGAASLGSLNITLIGDLYQGRERAKIMGYNASVLSIGTATYPAIGGALAMIAWYVPFIMPVVAIPVGIWTIMSLKNPEPENKQDFGSYMRQSWKNINKQSVWGIFIICVLIFVVIYGAYLSYFPLMMKERHQASALQIGLLMSGFSVITAITSAQLGRINKLLKTKNQLLISFGLYAISLLVLAWAHSWWALIIPIIGFGAGHGMVIPGIQNLLVGLAPIQERAAFMSVNSMVLRIGQTIGPIFIGIFYGLGGISRAFLAGSGVSVAMIVITLVMVKIKE